MLKLVPLHGLSDGRDIFQAINKTVKDYRGFQNILVLRDYTASYTKELYVKNLFAK